MDYVISVFLNLCSAVSLMLLNETWLSWRFSKCRWQLFLPLIAGADIVFFYLIRMSTLNPIPPLCARLLLTFLFFDGNILLQAFITVCNYILSGCMDYLASYIICWTQKIPFSQILNSVPLYMAASLTSKLLLIFLCYAIFVKFRASTRYPASFLKWIQMLLYPCISIGTILLSAQSLYVQDAPSTGLVLLVLGLVTATLLQLFLLQKIDTDTFAQQQNQLLQQKLEIQSENLQELTQAYDAQRSATHDFVNHLLALDGLLDEPTGQAHAYIQNALGACQDTMAAFHTGNAVADVLLNRHYAKAQNGGIRMAVQSCDLSALPLPDDILTIVLGNLLDNAQEACAKCTGERDISVVFHRVGGNWLFTITNTCPPDTAPEQATSKKDKRLHGYGLRNVQNALKKCSGMLYTEIRQGCYIASVCIPD